MAATMQNSGAKSIENRIEKWNLYTLGRVQHMSIRTPYTFLYHARVDEITFEL